MGQWADGIRQRTWRREGLAGLGSVGNLGPTAWAARALGFRADGWQSAVLESTERKVVLCCTRQWGKTTVTAVRALHQALREAGSLTVCLASSGRQSSIFLECVERFAERIGLRWRRDRREPRSMVLANGSMVVGLPTNSRTIRGFGGVSFLILDEAAYIPDEVYRAARPFRATTNGRFWVMSTPNGQSGFFYDLCHRPELNWRKFVVAAPDCPRISREFLREEELEMGSTMFSQEYLCRFLPSADQWISRELVDRAIRDDEAHPASAAVPKVMRENRHVRTARPVSRLFLGLDLGFARDRTALVVVEEMTRATGEYDHILFADRMETVLVLRHVEACPLRTPYGEVARMVERVLAAYPVNGGRELAVDATGVGLAVVEMLREAELGVKLTPIVLTGGESVGESAHAVTVPRKHLLHNLRRMFEMGGLRIPANLPRVGELREELVALGNPGGGRHDDLAFALALALWVVQPVKFVGEGREHLPGSPGGDSAAAMRYVEAELRLRGAFQEVCEPRPGWRG